jgi:hypothetical protein
MKKGVMSVFQITIRDEKLHDGEHYEAEEIDATGDCFPYFTVHEDVAGAALTPQIRGLPISNKRGRLTITKSKDYQTRCRNGASSMYKDDQASQSTEPHLGREVHSVAESSHTFDSSANVITSIAYEEDHFYNQYGDDTEMGTRSVGTGTFYAWISFYGSAQSADPGIKHSSRLVDIARGL